MSEFDRYSRQLLVGQIGEHGQRQIAKATVLIIGAGGLGCQVAAQLAGAGVGDIRIVDHDVVNLSNLHRQVLFREADLGQSKARVAAREMRAINSQINVSALETRLALDNVKELIKLVDLVIDAADNFATSYLLSDACLEQGTPMLSTSVNRTFGYLGVFCGSEKRTAPSVRAVFPKLPLSQQSCDTVGVTGPSVGIMASLQAQEALKVLLDDEQQLLGKLLYCDLWNYKQHIIDFSGATEPETSGIKLINAAQILQSDKVIDVRSADEINRSPQTFRVNQHIPLANLVDHITALPNGQRIVLACQTGQRALMGAQQLLNQGHQNIAVVLPDSSSSADGSSAS
ncbi:MAG: molybdopterin/thiamine biosynthesis adenylyltransferase/rhodanese-related sulfurtransferase [Dinoroseobacter sp.]|jgi:molybdopterin/thiamine biosynthesis adenylyltransferase/rhodanese-related sulfurtransferase